MKDLTGSASAAVGAPRERCYELLRDVERYPTWYPEVIKGVEVLERDAAGAATKVRTKLHLAYGPLTRDFEVTMIVEGQRPSAVTLAREPHHPADEERFDVAWRVDAGTIAVQLTAALPVPRMVPLGGIGDSVAQGFAAAAARQLSA